MSVLIDCERRSPNPLSEQPAAPVHDDLPHVTEYRRSQFSPEYELAYSAIPPMRGSLFPEAACTFAAP
jgi:hypothetical protein